MTLNMTLLHNFYVWARSVMFNGMNAPAGTIYNGSALQSYNSQCHCIGDLKDINGNSIDKFSRWMRQTSTSGTTNNQTCNNAATAIRYASQTLCGFTSDNNTGNGLDNYTYITIGSDNTESTSNQYELGNKLISGHSLTLGMSNYYDIGTNLGGILISTTIRNTGSENISIGEIGLNKKLAYNTNNYTADSSVTLHDVLLARTILTQKITLEPGQSISLQLSISM